MFADLESIRIFLRVVERGSFTAAATQLRLPLTSVSRRVKQLEDDLSVQLLYRTTRRVWVTDAGRDYYERCIQAEEILEEADQIARAVRIEPQGMLRVLMPYTLGLSVVEPRLGEFRQAYQKVQLALTYDNYPLDLIEHGFDVALRTGPLSDSGYSARTLGRSRAHLAASPAYLDRFGRPERPQDLRGHAIMIMGAGTSLATLRLLDDANNVSEIVVKPILTSNEATTIIRQAVAGAGIALISPQLAPQRFARGELEIVLPRWQRADDIELHALFPRRATSDRKVRSFVDFLAEVFKEWHV
ncbi:MAG: LysR family transcriptional regulator [Rhizobium sp.]|nr:MAG: LysR family transcriptional regulator [Rhizobium sp.]